MLVYGVPNAYDLTRIAGEVGVRLNDMKAKGKAWQFSLRPCGEHYRRLSPMGRMVWAVCWHGHEAFFRALFSRVPEARIVTRMATYAGRAEFDRLHEQTFGLVNHTGEECTCGKETS